MSRDGPNWALWQEPGERVLWEGLGPRPSTGRALRWSAYWVAVFALGIGIEGFGDGTGWLLVDALLWGLALYAPFGLALALWGALAREAWLLTDRRALAAVGRLGRWRIASRQRLEGETEVALDGGRVRVGGLSGVALEAGAEAPRVAGLARNALSRREGAP